MSIFYSISNIAKVGIAITVSPLAVIADIATLPSSAYNDQSAFRRTAKLFNNAEKLIFDAVSNEKGKS